MVENAIYGLYEQDIIHQQINYYILESEYIYEADNKVSLKERAKELIKKVIAAIKKFFTETLPNAYKYITMKLSKLNPLGKRTTVDPKAVVDNYKKLSDLYQVYGKEITEKDMEFKETIRNSQEFKFVPSNTFTDAMKANKILTAEELDAKDKNNHTAKEFLYAIDQVNKIRTNNISKLEKDLQGLCNEANKYGSSNNKAERVYYKMICFFSSIMSQITTQLNTNLRLLIRDCNGFKGAHAMEIRDYSKGGVTPPQ